MFITRKLHIIFYSQACRPFLFGKITALFLEELECSLLCLVTRLSEALQGLLACRMLSPGNNAPLLCLHQVLARQATAGVLGRTVIHLRLGSHRRHLLCATRHTVLLLASNVGVHYIVYAEISTWEVVELFQKGFRPVVAPSLLGYTRRQNERGNSPESTEVVQEAPANTH